MLKRIKETLTCTDYGGISRIRPKLKSHLLHSDKSTYFYKNSKVKRLPYSRYSTIPLVLSAFGLLILCGFMLSPSISMDEEIFSRNDKVYAEEGNSNEPVPYAVPPDDGVSLTLNTPLPDNDTIEQQVSGSGAKYITVDFTVGAHNVDDYKVFIQADSTTLTGHSYNDTITTITTPTSATAMNSATKQWGYAVVAGEDVSTDTMTFNSIQTGTTTPAATVTGANGSKILNHTQPYTLAFAANLDGAKADHYKSNITLSAAANAEEITLGNIGFGSGSVQATYMQDVDKTFCDKLPSVTSNNDVIEGRLIDKRDGKAYWVAKLKDGNCWMTQNLDLNLDKLILTSATSDVSNNFGPVKSEFWLGDYSNSSTWNVVGYYDSGMYIVKDGSKISADVGLFYDVQEGIKNYGWSPSYVSGFIDTTLYVGSDGQTVCEKEAGNKIGDLFSENIACRVYYYDYFSEIDYDLAHYIQGDFYSWNAATARTGQNTAVDEAAISSVCPSGWKMPLARGDGSYSSFSTDDIVKPPYYMIYGGYYYRNNSSTSLSNVGYYGYYWSATAYNAYDSRYNARSAYGTYLTRSTSEVSTPYDIARITGSSIRCVAR